jgi:hypothetical protein
MAAVAELHHNHKDDMFQRKAAKFTAYVLELSLLCAVYMRRIPRGREWLVTLSRGARRRLGFVK